MHGLIRCCLLWAHCCDEHVSFQKAQKKMSVLSPSSDSSSSNWFKTSIPLSNEWPYISWDLLFTFNSLVSLSCLFVLWLFIRVPLKKLFPIIVVRTNEVVLVERFGVYLKALQPGFHFLLPFADTLKEVNWEHNIEDPETHVTRLESLRTSRIPTHETMFDFPTFRLTTKDRITARVNGIMFFKITDPYKAAYEISDLYQAVEQLIYTSMRDAISKTTLDEAVEGKTKIRNSIYQDLEPLEGSWGVRFTKFDIQSIEAPDHVTSSIEKLAESQRQAQAELEKTRALQEAKKLKIQTEQEIELLQNETKNKIKTIEAQTQLEIAKINAESEMIATQKKAQAEAYFLEKILSIKGVTEQYLIQKEHTNAIQHLSKGNNKVIVIPMESAKYFGLTSVNNLESSGFSHRKQE